MKWYDTEQVVGFYSYKGGVGRTMMLCNTALALFAKMEGERSAEDGVLLVDLDLPAPGLRAVLGMTNDVRPPVFQGILDGSTHERSLEERASRVGNTQVFVLGDAKPDTEAVTFMSQLFAQDKNPELVSRAFSYLKSRGRTDFRAPFTCIDLGAGFGDLPREVFRLVDQIVLVARGDQQHRAGLPDVLNRLEDSFRRHKRPAVHIVLNQLPTSWMQDEGAEVKTFLAESGITEFIAGASSTEQIRTCRPVPLIQAALTHEAVLVPAGLEGRKLGALDGSNIRYVTKRRGERRLQKVCGDIAAEILEREVPT